MEARAYLRYVRISPRKVQIVLDLIRNKPADVAMAILKHTPKAACEPLAKAAQDRAMANAENNHSMDKKHLYVAECFVTPGPTLKRIRPRAQGRAFRVLKRTSHITTGAQGTRNKLKEEVNYGPKSKSARSSCGRNQRLGFPLVC